MAVVRLTFIFLLHCLCVLNINCEGELREYNEETYRPQIWSFLNYLNSLDNRAYNYNYATLLIAEQVADTTNLIIDIEVNCYRDSDKCITNLLQCAGSVRYNPETREFETLPEFNCAPKTVIDLSPDDESTDFEKVDAAMRSLDKETPTGSDESANEKEITPTIAHCVGCLIDLNNDAVGINLLTDTALKHIESERMTKQALVRVIRIQSQVVAGVKYVLTLEIAPTTCLKTAEQDELNSCVLDSTANLEICQITYLEQSWISKSKHIISNNCTETQEWSMDDPTPPNSSTNDLDNEIDVNYNYKKTAGYPNSDIVDIDNSPNYDSLADTGHADDILKMSGGIMDPSHMKEIESQVIYRTPEIDPAPQTESVLTDDQKDALDDFLGMMGDEPRQKRSTKNKDNDSSSSSSSSSSSEEDDNKDKNKKKHQKHDDNNNNNDDNDDDDDDDDNNVENNKEKYSKKKKYHKEEPDNNGENNDTSSSSSSSEEEKRSKREIIEQKHKHSQSSSEESVEAAGDHSSSEEQAKKKLKRSVGENNNKDSSSSDCSGDEQNNEDNRTKREIHNASSEENTSEEKTTDSPVPPKKTSSESEESSEGIKITGRRKRNIRTNNHLVKITPEEKNFVNNLATFSVNTLDNIDADTQKRVVLQMLGAKKSQQPDGTLYHLTLRVGISRCEEQANPEIDLTKINQNDEDCKDNLLESLTKICKVQVQVNSDKENPKVIKSHCQNMKKDHVDSDVNRTFRSKRGGIPGGVSDVDPGDPKIKQYAIDLLEQLDTQDGNGKQRELINVISATKQVVQGVRYKITVDLKFGGQSRKCLLDVWDQPWIKKDGKQVSVHCDNETEKKYRFRRSHKKQILGDEHNVNIDLFKGFAVMFNKTYSTKTEFKQRFQIFRKNMKMIKALNENEHGTAKYGPTKFADLTREEFKSYLGLNTDLENPNNIPFPNADIPDIEVPTEFDWRKKGAVSEVKNQGQCGSCWAFSVTGNIEGQNAIKTGKMIELSEQELVDCDKLDEGCNGGLPDNAYRAIEKLGGLETETDYPYEAEVEKCHFDKSLTRVQISGAVNISTNEDDMVKWLVQNGPISIGINANAMQFYMGGVSHPWKFLCDPTNLDHGVLIVGYGVHKYPLFNKVLPYWIVKNSWGPTWGEQGYYRVFRGDGTCGLNQMASSAVL